MLRDPEIFRTYIHSLFSDEIQGGASQDMYGMLDKWIDDGEVTEEEAIHHEMLICNVFDADWFTCTRCSWTLPMSDMADDEEMDEWYCHDCKD